MKAQKENQKQKEEKAKSSFLFEHIHLIKFILFFLFSFLFLGIYNADFLYKTQETLFFTYTDSCFNEMIRQSASPLIILSSFLTQTFYYPILGALIDTLLLVVLALLVKKVFHINKFYFLPSFLVLLTQTSVGYAIYDLFDSSFLFSIVLGSIFMVILIAIFNILKDKKFGLGLTIIISIIFCFLIGIYAPIALLVFYIIQNLHNVSKRNILGIILSLAIGGILPYFTSKYIYYEPYIHTLLSPFPSDKYMNIFILSFIVCLSFIVIAILQTKENNKFIRNEKIALALFFLLGFVTFFCSYRDSNFKTEIKMQRMAQKFDWKGITKSFKEIENPTKAIYAYYLIAINNQDMLYSKAFDFSCKFEKSKSKYLTGEPTYYEDLLFNASFFNTSYLWSMEFWTTIGYSYERLKKMTLCALMNEEYDLANKYIQQLQHTMFQSKWAEEYATYTNNIDLLFEKHPELIKIKREIPIKSQIVKLEPLNETYGMYDNLSYCNAERRLLADLYNKNMKAFSKDLLQMGNFYQKYPMPKYFKEAIIICAMNGDLNPIKKYNVEHPLAEKLKKFNAQLKKYKEEEVAYNALKEEYKGYYCLYYIFANNKIK